MDQVVTRVTELPRFKIAETKKSKTETPPRESLRIVPYATWRVVRSNRAGITDLIWLLRVGDARRDPHFAAVGLLAAISSTRTSSSFSALRSRVKRTKNACAALETTIPPRRGFFLHAASLRATASMRLASLAF